MKSWIALGMAATIQILASIITLQAGWGLEPKSWLVILGVGFGVSLFARILIAIDAPTLCPCQHCTPDEEIAE